MLRQFRHEPAVPQRSVTWSTVMPLGEQVFDVPVGQSVAPVPGRCGTARLRAMVFAAAGWPSSRTARASSASRMMWGSCRSWTGSEARSSQPSVLAVAEPAAAFHRCGLKACPYSAAGSVWAGGLLVVSLVSAG